MLIIPQDKLTVAVDEMVTLSGLMITTDKLSLAVPNRTYRIGTLDKPSSKNGWYRLFYDSSIDFITIVFGDWVTKIKHKHHINLKEDFSYNQLSHQEREERKKRLNAKIEAQRKQTELKNMRKRDYYVRLFNSFKPCVTHDYLTAKGITLSCYPFRINEKYNNNVLCIPFYNANGLQGYQAITSDGIKRFRGLPDGCYWQYPQSNPLPQVFTSANSFYILCEGIATGLSAYEAFNNYFDSQIILPIVLCGFTANNLSKVINATKANNLAYLLLVDNDNHPTINTGIETAKQILEEYQELEIYPITFSSGRDANDYINEYGQTAFIQLVTKYATPLIHKLFK